MRELTDARSPEGEKLGKVKEDFLKGTMSSITQSNQLLGKMDPQGDTKFRDFRYMVQRKIEQYQKEKNDPHDLFDPEKPDFLGKPERVRPYHTSLQQSMSAISEKLMQENKKLPETLPPDQMRRPGESYGDWKARQK